MPSTWSSASSISSGWCCGPRMSFTWRSLLIISAYALFLFTAVGAFVLRLRLSPDRLYGNLHVDRKPHRRATVACLKLDRPMDGRKFRLKALKHMAWIAGVRSGPDFTLVGYFTLFPNSWPPFFGLSGWELFWTFFYGDSVTCRLVS